MIYKKGEEKMEKGFSEVYPFATENVLEYFARLKLENQSVLTVGSSLDQLFNALFYGAKEITVFDINPHVKKFFEIKRSILLQSKREDFVRKVLNVKSKEFSFSKDVSTEKKIYEMNVYLQTDENYKCVQKLIQSIPIKIIEGDIFSLQELPNYDRIIFSNILQYLDYYFSKDCLQKVRELFIQWNKLLNVNGILQLLYLYSYSSQDIFKENHPICCYNLKKIVELLAPYSLDIEWINGFYEKKDAIITYTKKR